MRNFKLYKIYLIRFPNLLCSSRAIQQFCFLHHFWIILFFFFLWNESFIIKIKSLYDGQVYIK
jgi:hypothetical protein